MYLCTCMHAQMSMYVCICMICVDRCYALFISCIVYVFLGYGGAQKGGGASTNVARGALQPIEAPSISLDMLNEATENFGAKTLIGEGSYGRVYYATLFGRASAVKKLDLNNQQESDDEFLSQVSQLSQCLGKFCFLF